MQTVCAQQRIFGETLDFKIANTKHAVCRGYIPARPGVSESSLFNCLEISLTGDEFERFRHEFLIVVSHVEIVMFKKRGGQIEVEIEVRRNDCE